MSKWWAGWRLASRQASMCACMHKCVTCVSMMCSADACICACHANTHIMAHKNPNSVNTVSGKLFFTCFLFPVLACWNAMGLIFWWTWVWFRGPSWIQHRPKIDTQGYQNQDAISNGFRMVLGQILGRFWKPSWL